MRSWFLGSCQISRVSRIQLGSTVTIPTDLRIVDTLCRTQARSAFVRIYIAVRLRIFILLHIHIFQFIFAQYVFVFVYCLLICNPVVVKPSPLRYFNLFFSFYPGVCAFESTVHLSKWQFPFGFYPIPEKTLYPVTLFS